MLTILGRLVIGLALLLAAAPSFAQPAAPSTRLLDAASARHAALLSAPPSWGPVEADRLVLMDLGQRSDVKRLYLLVRRDGGWQVERTLFVAHGNRKGHVDRDHYKPDELSNVAESKRSPFGALVVSAPARQRKCSSVGRCIRLDGADMANANAYDREIVVHSNETRTGLMPKTPKGKYFVPTKGMYGRSNGCPLVADEDLDTLIAFMRPGVMLFIGRSDTDSLH